MTGTKLTLNLTPHGHLALVPAVDAPELPEGVARRLQHGFSRGPGHGLLRLGGAEVGEVLPPVFGYWRQLSTRYLTSVCTRPGAKGAFAPPEDLAFQALSAPIMTGAEYLTEGVLAALWTELVEAFRVELRESGGSVAEFLKGLSPVWHVVGRVHFNLAENKGDDEAPFAFLATYTTRVTAHGKAQHAPLGEALREYAGVADKERLLALLLPVQRAADACPWLRQMVDEGEVFHPLRWSIDEAFRLLGDAPALEKAGIVVRMPATWKGSRPPRPRVLATVGGKAPSSLGGEALLDFKVELSLGEERLTPSEVAEILSSTRGLVMVRGRWVEVDRERLSGVMERFKSAERLAREGGVTFQEAMRMLAGADIEGGEDVGADPEWSRVVPGVWLKGTLKGLRSPEGLETSDPGRELQGALRPYQEVGARWLHLLSRLGLGACLADDMGLGKTVQLLAHLLVERREMGRERRPSLLVAPASLLANWAEEIERFAPSLEARIAHPSAMTRDELKGESTPAWLSETDLAITTYGSLLRLPWLQNTKWHLVVLDEAQAIKNPTAKQTRLAKRLEAHARVALTGTPVENRLSDLWSIFDFINPGLLGSVKEFSRYVKRLEERPENPFGPLRDLVRPYILRRLKTDKTVIADLPDKTEVKAYCQLRPKQVALYEDAVGELTQELGKASGMRRKGVVLSFLVRLKQICNHPSHWLSDGEWAERDSGKWVRLRELAEVIAAKQEKALVFTQFREMTAPLLAFLSAVFGRAGLVLHGETPVGKRRELVKRFQEDESVPFFVLSLKAGGSGLNLTAASHVVHFDRWWNPAVENQATDRAFRIGQRKNVLVHKFLCRGTVEEKIDQLIESKKDLSRTLLEGQAELNLTELDDDEILKLVALDLGAVVAE